MTNSEVERLEGEPGRFTLSLINQPRFIDPDRCTACGQCMQACPVTAVNEFNGGLDRRAAPFIPYAQAVPASYAIDRDACIGCGLCENVCLAEAIRYDDSPRRSELEVGAVVLAPGTDPFDPSRLDAYGYSAGPNVVTSVEFERILSASGPFRGHLMRPYDREEPRKIAWIQCVGSRSLTEGEKPYCSAVCCMYAIKEAVIAQEHAHCDLDTAIFYMDMRTCGKDFDEYYGRAERDHGVRFIRSRVHTVEPLEEGDVRIHYVDERGRTTSEVFELVVLSVGFSVPDRTVSLARMMGVELDQHGFAGTGSFTPVETSRPGIYTCGCFSGPKDIPQSVMEASAAAASSSVLLSDRRWTETAVVEMPRQRNVIGEPPRIGVFVCRCGINIAGVVDVPAVRDYALTLPYVTYVEDNLYTCSQDTQDTMARVIEEQGINRVVVAACTPKTHEPLFQETMINAGLNKYLFEMANIRNQDSWVHSKDPAAATEKAKDLVRMAVAKAAFLEPLEEIELDLNPVTLVLGGGVAGMVASKNLADQGYHVHLVERTGRLGGRALDLFKTWKGESVRDYVGGLEREVTGHPRISVHRSSELSEVGGFVGNFTSRIRGEDGSEETIEHGLAVVATGAREHRPDEYLYGRDPRVLTHHELDRRFLNDDPSLATLRSAVFIQCVGSREPDRTYCSRVCCTHTMSSALELKRRNPAMNVYVCYRDMRTYGVREDLYREARRQGVLFFRYDLDEKPLVRVEGDELVIEVNDRVLDRPVRIEADLITLATAVVPHDERELAGFFKIPVSSDGFFIEAHAKLRPVDFATEGIFLCGMAHHPKSVDESIAQALAAAGRAAGFLASGKIRVSGTVAEVDPAACSRCGACIEICPFKAPSFSEQGPSAINPVLCKGCGLCIASCRSGAIKLKGFDTSQIMAMIAEV